MSTEPTADPPDLFPSYIDRSTKNPCDLEHIWPDDYTRYESECPSRQDFDSWRNNVAGLLLLPADVNRSYQDKAFQDKAPHYAKQNLLAASLNAAAYEHQPQFRAFATREGLTFKAYASFGKAEQTERRLLMLALAEKVWSPDRLKAYLD